MSLRTDFKDEMLPEGQSYRTYNIVDENGDTIYSNIHLAKAYTPLVEGDVYGAAEINETNRIVNEVGGTTPITKGGTGATTASEARNNLGLSDNAIRELVSDTKLAITLLANGWRSNTQIISDPFFQTGNFSYTVAVNPPQLGIFGESMIYAEAPTVNGQIKFHCADVPSEDIKIDILKNEVK